MNRLINFSDGVFSEETQNKLTELLPEITHEELDEVQERLLKILTNVGRKNGERYNLSFMPNVMLQITLRNKTPKIQYGAHMPSNIKIIKMRDVNNLKGRVGELIILAHECGHAMLGDKNYSLADKYGTKMMEKITDEVAKFKLREISPGFYDMYSLCRNTHHYDTKEGDFKEFFKDIINVMEDEWGGYLKKYQPTYID